MNHCNPISFIKKIDKEYQELNRELKLRYSNIIFEYLVDIGLKYRLENNYDWESHAESVMDGSMGELSLNDSKTYVLNNFLDYLKGDDREFAVGAQGVVYEWITDIISDELGI